MNILTDILSLIKRGKFTDVASNDDVIVLGMWNEKPEMTGVASPIPYKSVKLIKVRDLAKSENCDYTNVPAIPAGGTVGIYKGNVIDPTTKKCTVSFRSLKSLSSNLTLAVSADDNYIEITTEGEPNLAANVGTGSGIWKNKIGETLNFKSLKAGNNISLTETADEITISSTGGGSSISLTTTGTSGAATLNSGVLNIPQYTTSFSVYDEEGGPGFTVDDGESVLMFSSPTIGAITGVPVGTPPNPNSISMSLMWSNHVSLLTQSGTSAPTMTMLLDNGVSPFTWTYVAIGTYQATLSTSFTDLNKVSFEIQNKFSGNGAIPYVANIVNTTTTGFTVKTFRLDTGEAVDNVLENTALEIKIYG
jgi:hypothetical protein